jgi:hypothetical protein
MKSQGESIHIRTALGNQMAGVDFFTAQGFCGRQMACASPDPFWLASCGMPSMKSVRLRQGRGSNGWRCFALTDFAIQLIADSARQSCTNSIFHAENPLTGQNQWVLKQYHPDLQT